jgi:hypothetical protein
MGYKLVPISSTLVDVLKHSLGACATNKDNKATDSLQMLLPMLLLGANRPRSPITIRVHSVEAYRINLIHREPMRVGERLILVLKAGRALLCEVIGCSITRKAESFISARIRRELCSTSEPASDLRDEQGVTSLSEEAPAQREMRELEARLAAL